ncbi:MAG TPA: molecular chaperone HtpG [Haloplasmataceae bacterium]
MAKTREFKAESKELLNLMINSIYSNKDIFIRELISNASDAIDKYNFISLTNENVPRVDEYEIVIERDEARRTITIRDNGIGMTEEELIENLGTIAKSGTKAFLEKMKELTEANANLDTIGQFGVGFYSAFMVAKKVEVKTRSPFSETGYLWSSEGVDTYTIEPIDKPEIGTEIIVYLREDEEDVSYSQYLDEYRLKEIVKKYSNYIRYPIKMLVTKQVPKEEKDKTEYETVQEWETVNSMIPIWRKNRNEVTDEELNEFYRYQFNDYLDPMKVIQMRIEGALNYDALIFIPKKAPYDLYSDKYEKGLQLYSKGVFIMDKCKELVPDYLKFVKGLVDSPDLSLNISREILQQNRQVQKIANNIEKKIINELKRMLRNEREQYIEFFETYGVHIKFGVYENYGEKKELLKDLLLFYSSETKNYTTLSEYVERMKEGQEYIYYATGQNRELIEKLPQMEQLKEKKYEVLFFTDDIDEFAINMLREYEGKRFKNISTGDLGLESEEEKKEREEKAKEHKGLLKAIEKALKDRVSEVRLSSRLKDSAVCLVSKDSLSLEMEKILSNMRGANGLIKAERVLEINPNHRLFKALENVYERDKKAITTYAEVLYNQALLIEGFPLEDPVSFANQLNELLIKASESEK